jgi:hypothetical protein
MKILRGLETTLLTIHKFINFWFVKSHTDVLEQKELQII